MTKKNMKNSPVDSYGFSLWRKMATEYVGNIKE